MLVEPLWWAKAREMHARGVGYGVIGRVLKKHHTAVMYAVRDPSWRNSRKAKSRARYAVQNIKTPPRSPEQHARHKVVEAAHEEAESHSTHVDLVLIAWGQPARREMQSRRAWA